MAKKIEPTTLEITDFTGRLTRKPNGAINSGFAKFDSSWGYDPFSKPGNLTWFESPVDLDPNDTSIGETIVCGKSRIETGNQLYIYAIGTNYVNTSKLFKIQPNSVGNPNLDTSSVLATLTNNSFLYGGSMDFFGTTEKIYYGNDSKVVSINFDGSGETAVSGTFTANIYRPLTQFLGNLIYGDGTNIGKVTVGGTATSSVLSPSLPPEVNVQDISVSPDGNYLSIAGSLVPTNRQDYSYDRISAATGSGYVYDWNGIDAGITKFKSFPSHAISAFKTYMNNQFLFSMDSFGLSLDDTSGKRLTLQNNRSVIPNSIVSNGNFVSWMSTEFADSTLKASMYYYGRLDEESPSGLWRMFRQPSSIANGFVYTVPFNILAGNKFSTLNSAETAVTAYGYGKHYFSTLEIPNGGGTSKNKLYRFLVTPSGSGTPTLGVYETQTQLFSKRISLSEIRVYTEPTTTGNGFQLDIIGSDGNVVTGGTYTYTYAAGSDLTRLQGPVERINFNTNVKNLYALGLRITNTGTTNMTIKKVEVDWGESGK